jgi:hypothetical protein
VISSLLYSFLAVVAVKHEGVVAKKSKSLLLMTTTPSCKKKFMPNLSLLPWDQGGDSALYFDDYLLTYILDRYVVSGLHSTSPF